MAPSREHPDALPNPELRWERRDHLGSVDVAEIERWLGERVDDPWTVLSGGLANTNVRIGSRVVRIHRRDPSAASLEASLLLRPWSALRVPQVLRIGDGFLVLEYVAHGPLLGTVDHGAAVGGALAEVHSVSFETAGHIDASLRVVEPFSDLVGVLIDYSRAQLENPSGGLKLSLRDRTIRALETTAVTLREVAGPPVLLHADFKPSNLHWTTDDRLLVLDWEFAYAGAALSDIGQLLRWGPPERFIEAFAASYRAHGGRLVEGWQRWAAAFDLVNLAGLLANLSEPAGGGVMNYHAARRPEGPPSETSQRVADVGRRIEKTLALIA